MGDLKIFLLSSYRTYIGKFLASSFSILSFLLDTFLIFIFPHIFKYWQTSICAHNPWVMWPRSLFLLSLSTVINIEFPELFSNLTVSLLRMELSCLIYFFPFAVSSFAQLPLFSHYGFISKNLTKF